MIPKQLIYKCQCEIFITKHTESSRDTFFIANKYKDQKSTRFLYYKERENDCMGKTGILNFEPWDPKT